MFFWLLHSALASNLSFYPSTGQELVSVSDGMLGGVPVRRTGAVLLRTTAPEQIARRADVAQVKQLPGRGHVLRVLAAAGVDEFELSRSLHDEPHVVWAHPDLALKTNHHSFPDDPYVGDQWHLENLGQEGRRPGIDMNVETAWQITSGAGQLIAILDTGVDLTHPDLVVTSGYDYIGQDDDSSPDREADDDGYPHGTASAGLAAARGFNGEGIAGVAHGADIYAIRMLGDYLESSDIYTAIVEAADAGAAVLSNSWGIEDGCEGYPLVASMEDAFNYLERDARGGLGAVFVQSAGNSGCDFTPNQQASHKAVISVGAVNADDQREWYSNYGSQLDIVAPVVVLTTDIQGEDGYGDWNGDQDYWNGYNGTSAAAPLVAGTMALMFAANERLTAKRARKVLCTTATRMDPEGGEYDATGWSPWYGCGRVDAGAAVAAVADRGPPTWSASPVVLSPTVSAASDRIVVRWANANDPDGRSVKYKLTWWREMTPNQVEELDDLHEPWVDLTGQIAEGGRFSFFVEAYDTWGFGTPSETVTVDITTPPVAEKPQATATDDSGGCNTSPVAPTGWALWMSLAVWMRRHRS